MRKYEPAWLELKKKRILRLAVPRPLHKRVIKAIIKEKWLDIGYKFERINQSYWDELAYTRNNNIIEFRLVAHAVLESVTVDSI